MATATELQQLYIAYFGRPADSAGLDYWVSSGISTKSFAAVMFAQPEFQSVNSGRSVETQVNQLYINLFGRPADAAGLLYWTNQINTGQIALASVANDLIISATNSGAASAADLAALTNKTSTAVSYTAGLRASTDALLAYQPQSTSPWISGANFAAAVSFMTTATATNIPTAAQINASVSSVGESGAGTQAQTLTLTVGNDTGASFIGTSAATTFDASGFFNGGTGTILQTLGNGDSIDGGLGTDTLNVALNTATATTRPAALTSIEVINLTNTVGTNILDLSNATGVTTLNSVNSATQIAQFDNVQSAPTAFGMTNTGVGLTANILNTALAGTADAATLTLNGVTAGTVTLQTITAASGYETLNIVSTGNSANVLTAVTDGNGTSLATINVSGTAAINLGANLDATVLTVNAADLSGVLTVVQTNAVKTTITGGSGADIIDISGAFVDLTDPTNADVINGGAGTDTLIMTAAEGAAVTAASQFANVTNIETVRFDTAVAAGINGTFFTGVNTFEFAGGIGAVSHTVASGTEIQYDLLDAGNDAQTFTITGVGTTDTMTIDINGVDIGNGTQTYVGIETLNIATSGTSLIDGAHVLTATAATEAVNISGTGTLTLGNITADAVTSTMTSGTLNLGTMQSAVTFTGGASADTITGSTSADILIGGAGADFLTNRAAGAAVTAGDVMTGGAGFDTFTLVGTSASTTNYSASSTITDFTVGSSTTNTDFLRFSGDDTSYDDDGLADSGIGDAAAADGAQAGDSVVIQSVAQNAAAAAVTAQTVNMIKLTTGVAFNTNLQTTFNDAIGTGTVTNLTADSQLLYSFYDTTNSVMVLGTVDVNAGGATTLQTADVVNLIATISMTAADYAILDADNFAVFV